jgi:hypothetical protein
VNTIEIKRGHQIFPIRKFLAIKVLSFKSNRSPGGSVGNLKEVTYMFLEGKWHEIFVPISREGIWRVMYSH